MSIYLWSGHAVAYVVEENFYGWNDQHTGWFVNGVLYNRRGAARGINRWQMPLRSACYAS
ncbi:4-fold beta flower protein [Pseudomonas sp. NPDC078416]|uniref:4-fold beta flower protein n=1 Tax=Pseudomonas sp. NPDC078416 TaxID=3390637 RepID=UPI003D08BBEA